MWKPYLGEDHYCVAFGEEDPQAFRFSYTYKEFYTEMMHLGQPGL